jgi:hypothetical protein
VGGGVLLGGSVSLNNAGAAVGRRTRPLLSTVGEVLFPWLSLVVPRQHHLDAPRVDTRRMPTYTTKSYYYITLR